MAISEKNIVLTDKDGQKIYLPATSLENVGDKAEVKAVPTSTDYIALMDSASNGQMKKALASTLKKAIGFEKVNNTSDADKPLSNAQQTAISKLSNPNLLDNWYFADLVNQRGKNEYTAVGYAIDRWYLWGTLTIKDGYITHTITNQYWRLQQTIEKFDYMIGNKIILSAFVRGKAGQYVRGVLFKNHAGVIPGCVVNRPLTTDGWEVVKFPMSISADEQISILEMYFYTAWGKDGGSLDIKAIKLELGDRQTLAHQDADGNWILNDPPPNIALELAKCQRYQFSLFRQDGYQGYIGPLQSEGGTTAYGMITAPVSLRAKPAIVVSDYARLLHMFPGGQARTVTNISAYGYTANQVQIKVTFNGNVPAGYCGYIRADNPSEDLLIVDANL